MRHSSNCFLTSSTRFLFVLKTVAALNSQRIRDGHLTNITNKQARKYRNFTFSDRYGFKICEKLTHWTRAKNIACETVWLFLKSTHLVHPCKPHHGGTPLENSGASWGVRYTRLTSTGVENFERGRSILNVAVQWIWFFKFTLSCSFNFFKPRWVVRRQQVGWILVVLDNFLKSHVSRLRLHVASPFWKKILQYRASVVLRFNYGRNNRSVMKQLD